MFASAIKPPPNDLHEADFYAGTQEQARAIEQRRRADVDIENVPPGLSAGVSP
jgi:hypothetical protein